MQYKEAKGGYKELANSIYRDSCHIRKATKCIGCTLMFSEREIISIIFIVAMSILIWTPYRLSILSIIEDILTPDIVIKSKRQEIYSSTLTWRTSTLPVSFEQTACWPGFNVTSFSRRHAITALNRIAVLFYLFSVR